MLSNLFIFNYRYFVFSLKIPLKNQENNDTKTFPSLFVRFFILCIRIFFLQLLPCIFPVLPAWIRNRIWITDPDPQSC